MVNQVIQREVWLGVRLRSLESVFPRSLNRHSAVVDAIRCDKVPPSGGDRLGVDAGCRANRPNKIERGGIRKNARAMVASPLELDLS